MHRVVESGITMAMTEEEFFQAVAPTLHRVRRTLHRIYNNSDEFSIAPLAYTYCADELGGTPSEVLFLGVSMAAVFGLRLGDGRRVVVKFHAGSGSHLSRVYEIQEYLRQSGVPCARLISAPKEIHPDIHAVTHELFAPGRELPINPGRRLSIAKEYARLMSLTKHVDAAGIPVHKLNFDRGIYEYFPGLRDELEHLWQGADKIIAHPDFRIRNLLFCDDQVSAIFDFDALQVLPSLLSIANTAVNFMRPRGHVTIDLHPEQTFGFLLEFARARGTDYTSEETDNLRPWLLEALISMTMLPHYRQVPSAFLAERIKHFDRALGDLWPRWRA